MKKSTLAALLSGLIYPGAGHYYLDKKIAAIVIAGIASAALYLLVSNTIERALAIVEKIETGQVSPTVAAITDLVSQQTAESNSLVLNIATLVVLGAWLVGIADSYRLGRKLDSMNTV